MEQNCIAYSDVTRVALRAVPSSEGAGFRWDLDGDGTFETRGRDSGRVVEFFSQGAEHIVAVLAKAPDGGLATDTLSFMGESC